MFSSSPLKFLQTFLWLLALQISNTTMGQNKCCWCCNWQIIEDQQVKVVAQWSYYKMEKEEYQIQVNKVDSRMKEAHSYIKRVQHSSTLPKQLSTFPSYFFQVLWSTLFALNHPGKCFDPLKVKKLPQPPTFKASVYHHSSQYMDFVTMQHYQQSQGGLFGYCPTRQCVFLCQDFLTTKCTPIKEANIQIVGANCSKPLPLFGNIC